MTVTPLRSAGMVAPHPPSAALKRLTLADFRGYGALDLRLSGRHVVLTGDNGAGKTNLLEAVSLLAPGRGLRRARLDEMTRTGAERWTVSMVLNGADGETRIGTGLEPGAEEGERSRKVRIDGEPARAEDLADHVAALWLTPAMDGLFTGPPGDRRRFLDRLVLALDAGHGARVAAFERAMRGRNRLLEDDRIDAAWASAIEAQMAELGVAVAAARAEAVGCLVGLIERTRVETSAFPHAELALVGDLESNLGQDLPSAEIEDRYRARLAASRGRDKAAGRTLEGPHRSDLKVKHGPKGVPAERSSTGEQKALLIGLVMAQARLAASSTGRPPLLLLDEIAAHLDARRRASLFDRLDEIGGQCWMTGTDVSAFAALGGRAENFHVADAEVRPA